MSTFEISKAQALVTRSKNKLSALLDKRQGIVETQVELPPEEHKQREYLRSLRKQVQETRDEIDTEKQRLRETVKNYNRLVDSLDPSAPGSEEIYKKAERINDEEMEVDGRAEDFLDQLRKFNNNLDIDNIKDMSGRNLIDDTKMLPIPVPKFSGKIWEWESFWRCFDHSVHSRPLDDFVKMKYLVEALQGDAKEIVDQYEVSKDSYLMVIEHLKEKYGNKQILVNKLLQRLRDIQADSRSLEDQERLCESLHSIVNQLKKKGEHVDSTYLQLQILEKFTADIEQHVLEQKDQLGVDDWETNEMLMTIKSYLRKQIVFKDRMKRRAEWGTQPKRRERQSPRTNPKPMFCFYCENLGHSPINCETVRSLDQRLKVMKDRALCHNCGRANHRAAECRKGYCRICNGHHHTSICKEQFGTPGKDKKEKCEATSARKEKPLATSVRVNKLETNQLQANHFTFKAGIEDRPNGQILVGSAKVLNLSKQTREPVEVILDTGSDQSFISEELAHRLELQDINSADVTVHTFGEQEPFRKTYQVALLEMWDDDGEPHKITVMKTKKISQPIRRSRLNRNDKEFLRENGIKLSIDPNVTSIQPQVLLGCSDVVALLGKEPHTKTLPSGLTLISTKIGYLVAGKENCRQKQKLQKETNVRTENIINTSHNSEEQSWEDFWTFESSGIQEFSGPISDERERHNALVWKKFEETVDKRKEAYYVRLPWKKDTPTLPDNKNLAVQRMKSTMAKLTKKPDLLKQYHETITQQLHQGVIEEVDESEPTNGPIHYLAHQAVITPQKETTKLRVVFDASAHLKGCPSLNDVLHRGPVMIPTILEILLRFRIGKVALISDVEKAFLQIRLHEDDRNATRFLWVRDITQPNDFNNTVVYRFTRVTFGLNCSPFLLSATIRHHLEKHVEDATLAQELARNTYVDNVITTAASTEQAVHKYAETKRIFKEMGMNLREFLSNEEDLMETINLADIASRTTQKVLGILWNSKKDELLLSCRYPERSKVTKRTVAEQVAAVYDPLGWLTPLTLRGKQFLQSLWKFDYKWDDALTDEHKEEWKKIVSNMNDFELRVPRQASQLGKPLKLVAFADANKATMATCVYLISDTDSHLLIGKTKLTSLKEKHTIPKLELNALTMATRIAQTVSTAIQGQAVIKEIIIMSDSQIALNWLKSPKTDESSGILVNNRVKEIRRIVESLTTAVRFGFVTTEQNPADCATRGLNKAEIKDHMWWKGPPFIRQSLWQSSKQLFTLQSLQEESATGEEYSCNVMQAIGNFLSEGNMETTSNDHPQTQRTIPVSAEDPPIIDDMFESLRRYRLSTIKRIVALVLRFIRKSVSQVNLRRNQTIKLSRLLENVVIHDDAVISGEEISIASKVLIKQHQSKITPSIRHSLNHLNTKVDSEGLLRCIGRLGKSDLNTDTKNPLLILQNSWLAQAIIRDCHDIGHPGVAHTMALVRRKFWIPKLRNQVTRTLRNCVQCQKFNNLPYKYPAAGDLPERRVRRSYPFAHVGLDYFGPLLITKADEAEGKCYGAIITCMATRLIHLEIVSDLSTTAFLMMMRRFFARRGIPRSITSDNAPTFLLGGTILNEQLQAVQNDPAVARQMSNHEIRWHKIAPFAPWQGGFYERLIKSVKHSLYKSVGRTKLSLEQLSTTIVEIEALLNTRPLTYIESESTELQILRPIDFIQNEFEAPYTSNELVQETLDPTYLPPDEQVVLRTKQQAVQALLSSCKSVDKFWNTWKSQYLTSLREKHQTGSGKNKGARHPPQRGDVVLIDDPMQPRHTWKIGRIDELVANPEGVVREAVVLLPHQRRIRRPVNRLVPLELAETKHRERKEDNDYESKDERPTQSTMAPSGYNLRRRKQRTANHAISPISGEGEYSETLCHPESPLSFSA